MKDVIYGKTYLCLSCDHENLKAEFGRSITCPECGSQNVVNATFWRMFKSMKNSKKERRTTENCNVLCAG